jgi:hypothetical protein
MYMISNNPTGTRKKTSLTLVRPPPKRANWEGGGVTCWCDLWSCRAEVNYRREGGTSPAQAVMGLLLIGRPPYTSLANRT